VDYGGTLIFVSHDRYFVERLATKIVEVGAGTALVYPGTYTEFLWHKEAGGGDGQDGTARGHAPQVGSARGHAERSSARHQRRDAPGVGPRRNWKNDDPDAPKAPAQAATPAAAQPSRDADAQRAAPRPLREEKKRTDADARRKARAEHARRARIEELEARIAATEQEIHETEQAMAAPGFYDDRAAAQATIDRHQALMWAVGDLMGQWEGLQKASDLASAADV
jgi:ATP-binding cassette subfamily F protein 3